MPKRFLKDLAWTSEGTIVARYGVYSEEQTVLEERTVRGKYVRSIPYRKDNEKGVHSLWKIGIHSELGEGVYSILSKPFDNNFSLIFTPMGTLDPLTLLEIDGAVYSMCISTSGNKIFLSIRGQSGEDYHGYLFDVQNKSLTPYEKLNKTTDCVWANEDLIVAITTNGTRDVWHTNIENDTMNLLEKGSGRTHLTASRDGRLVAWRYFGERKYTPYMKVWLQSENRIVDVSKIGMVGDISLSKDGSRLAFVDIRSRKIKIFDTKRLLEYD